MKQFAGFLYTFVFAGLLLISGCTVPDNTAEFWTNIPEMAAYASLFNSVQTEHRIKIVYKKNPADALYSEPGFPDLVVSTNLNSSQYDLLLENLSPLLDPEKGSINGGLFYPELLQTGINTEQEQKTLPVSFNLPLLYYKINNGITDESAEYFSWEDLREEGKQFTGSEEYPVRSFSPLWSGDYIYEQCKLNGVNFKESDGSFPQWNQEKLTETLDDIKNISPPVGPPEEDDEDYPPEGSLEWELAFQEKYLYQPWFKSVNSGRILYAYTTMWDFHLIPTAEKKSLGIRWISNRDKVPVCDDILYAGVLKRGEDKKAAKAFLTWLFQLESQNAILQSSQYKRLRSFGIARGFSSLIRVNELDFPRFFPILEGKIPGQTNLLFPEKLPQGWEEIRKDVLVPWIIKKTRYPDYRINLDETLRNWYNLRPDLQ